MTTTSKGALHRLAVERRATHTEPASPYPVVKLALENLSNTAAPSTATPERRTIVQRFYGSSEHLGQIAAADTVYVFYGMTSVPAVDVVFGSLSFSTGIERHPALVPLSQLADNWDHAGAEAPKNEALQNAADTLSAAEYVGLVPRSVLPSAEGGVVILFKTISRYADVECLNTGEILATISDGSGKPVVWQVNATELQQTLAVIRAYLA